MGLPQQAHCNLSPQGDENGTATAKSCFAIGLQFIPARGRKLNTPWNSFRLPCIAIYPRKGTKTAAWLLSISSSALQFIPARGRKHTSLNHTKPLVDCNLSPQGDENPPNLSRLIIFRSIAIYPPKPSQALRASSPEGRAFPAAVTRR